MTQVWSPSRQLSSGEPQSSCVPLTSSTVLLPLDRSHFSVIVLCWPLLTWDRASGVDTRQLASLPRVSPQIVRSATRLLLARQRSLELLQNQHVNHRLGIVRKAGGFAAVGVK